MPTTIPEGLVPPKLPSAPLLASSLEATEILRFHSQVAHSQVAAVGRRMSPVGRTMSSAELAEHILKELQRVGDTELALCAQYPLQTDYESTVRGEWEIGRTAGTEVVTSEIKRRFLQALLNAAKNHVTATAQSLITRLSEVAHSEDDAIEFAYHELHQLIDCSEFEIIDEFLRALRVDMYFNSVLLSILTITALTEVKGHLCWRPEFYDRVKARFVEREGNETAEELLVGLD